MAKTSLFQHCLVSRRSHTFLYRTQPSLGTVLNHVSVHVPNHVSVHEPKCGWVLYRNIVRYMYRNVVEYRTETWFATCTKTWLSTVPKRGSVHVPRRSWEPYQLQVYPAKNRPRSWPHQLPYGDLAILSRTTLWPFPWVHFIGQDYSQPGVFWTKIVHLMESLMNTLSISSQTFSLRLLQEERLMN